MNAPLDPPDVRQAASPVAGHWAGFKGWQKLGAGAAALAGLTALVMMPDLFGSGAKAPEPPPGQIRTPAPEPFQPPAQGVAARTGLAPDPPRAGDAQIRPPRRPRPTPIAVYEASAQSQAARQQPSPGASSATPGTDAGLDAQGRAAGDEGPDSLARQVGGAVSLDTEHAGVLRAPDYTLTAGTKFECGVSEAIDSSLGGFVMCRVPEWVKGTTLRRGLIPPGSKVFGQIKGGLDRGQRRLGILFTRIETSGDHMVIRMNAPAADSLGRAGVDGELDTFFWDRAGAVALYALLDAGIGAGQAAGAAALSGALSGGGGTVLSLGNIGGQAQGLASQEMAARINRRPRLTRPEGQVLMVSVGQDLDFYKACRSRMRVNPVACPLQ